jgi:DNA-directed RNA polymerase alpha subunit
MGGKGDRADLPENLAKPAKRALANAGVHDLDQLADKTESELLKLHGMGQKALGQLRLALADKGKAFAVEEENA